MSDAVKLYNPNDGVFGRDGGPYLDQVQARQAEELRAYREGREPNYDDPQPHPGISLVTEEQLLRNGVARAGAEQLQLTKIQEEARPQVYAEVPKEVVEADKPADEAIENDPALSNAGADGDPAQHVAPSQQEEFDFTSTVDSTPEAGENTEAPDSNIFTDDSDRK